MENRASIISFILFLIHFLPIFILTLKYVPSPPIYILTTVPDDSAIGICFHKVVEHIDNVGSNLASFQVRRAHKMTVSWKLWLWGLRTDLRWKAPSTCSLPMRWFACYKNEYTTFYVHFYIMARFFIVI